MTKSITKKIVLIAACLWVAISCSAVRAETVLIKLATVAPAGSTWHEYLQDLDAQWRQASGGQVRLQIYAGTLGDEEEIMRRVRIGQIDAATVTSAGLSTIDQATKALYIPLAFASYDELDYVQTHIAASLEKVLRVLEERPEENRVEVPQEMIGHIQEILEMMGKSPDAKFAEASASD